MKSEKRNKRKKKPLKLSQKIVHKNNNFTLKYIVVLYYTW